MIAFAVWAVLYGSEVADGYIIAGLVTTVGVLITFLGWLGTQAVKNSSRIETVAERLDAQHERLIELERALLARGHGGA